MATDAAAIRELTRAAYAKWVPLIGREPKPMTANYENAVTRHRFDLLYVDGTLAALIETIREADHLLVENVAVSPSFQGRGLGHRLMAHAEVLARELGFGTIRLYTNQRFAENIAKNCSTRSAFAAACCSGIPTAPRSRRSIPARIRITA